MKILYYAMLVFYIFYSIYYIITGLCAFKNFNKKFLIKSKPKNKFAILIAARNEEKVIKNLLRSLKCQKYPKDLFEIIVIPNNCTDNTENIAYKEGASILKLKNKISSKGDALKLTFKKLQKRKDIDAFIIFDADNVVHPKFLSKMNDALCSGYCVAQGCRDSKNPSDNWISGSYSIFYWVQNFFFNKSRMQINGSASINGTGFMIKKDIIKKYGFDVKTITEDIEFTALCAINNIKIAYVEEAITYDEQPTNLIASYKQRKRWTTGTYQCLKKYNMKLLQSFLKNKNIASLDMFLNFLAPLVLIFGFLNFILIIFFKANYSTLTIFDLIIFIILYLITVFINIYIIKYNNKNIKNSLSAILLFVLFMFTWVPINIICLIRKSKCWEQINHGRNIQVNELIK